MTRLKNFINQRFHLAETIYWVLFILFLMLKCLYFQFTTKLNTDPYFSAVNITMFLSSFAILLIISAFIALILNKFRFIALFTINLLLTILLIADTNFFRYYYNLITIPVFFQLNIKMVSSVNESILSQFMLKDLIYLIDLPFMLTGVVLLSKNARKIHISRRAYRSVALLVVGMVTFLSVFQTSNLNSFAYNNNYSAKSLGVFFSHYYNTKLLIEENLLEDDNFTQEDKNSIKAFYEIKESEKNDLGSKLKGIAKDKNLIVVQMEALQQFVINLKINGKEVTPNLNRLIGDSLYFDNVFYQVAGGNTSDAEFLTNNSLYPAKEGAAYHLYPENTYHSLANILKDKGYNTYSLHGFEKTFWNRDEMHMTLGFDRFFNQDDFVLDDFAGWEGQALSDSSFFRQSLDKIDTSKPFYSFYITLSSHHPFNYFEDYDFDVGEFQGTYIGNYLKAANYLDKCIGEFIEDLKERGLYDNSLLVFYGDHAAVKKMEADGLMKLLDMEYSEPEWMKLQKVPLIIHYPNQSKPEVISTIGGQIDILPTVANLMDFDAPYALGKDLLNYDENEGYVILRDGSVITKDFIYFNDLREVYDFNNGKQLNLNLYADKITSYLNELNVSDIIITKDAFKHGFEK
ncbi:MAG TPA: LTA synthase family protein [Acetivibrio sp.]|uniref:LTA synthase family protein n=1 Tax=Acetivibrio sp. TaxID=1872092 RepID=UPI002BE3EB6B|nr:LTA synthase family protein [Acetivibrio sp.]HOM03040.1 LTA synthase family protein [Acetivibrio sp.]